MRDTHIDMKIKRFIVAAGIALFLTLTGCAEWWDFPGANQYDDGLIFSADGSLLVRQAGPNPKVWDTKTRKILWETNRGERGRIDSVIFSPDGQTLAIGDMDGSIKLRGAKSGALFWTGKHAGRVYALAFSPDGKFIASGVGGCGPADKPLKLWDAETGELLRAFDGAGDYVNSVGFSPDGKLLVSKGSEDRAIRLWNTETGVLARTLTGHHDYVVSVTFSPDGKLLASGSDDASVRLWDAETGKLLRKIMPVELPLQLLAPVAKKLFGWEIDGHSYGVVAVAFSPDGKTLASASADPVVKLWNIETTAE